MSPGVHEKIERMWRAQAERHEAEPDDPDQPRTDVLTAQAPSVIKMIVYDYGSDLIGTTEKRIH